MSPKPPGAMGSPYSGDSLADMLKTSLDKTYDYENSFNNHRTAPQEVPKTAQEKAAEEKIKEATEEKISKPIISVVSKEDKELKEAKEVDIVVEAITNPKNFDQDLKNELVDIVISNKLNIVEVSDSKIIFEFKGQKFLFIPV